MLAARVDRTGRNLLRCMSLHLARNGPSGPVWRSPLLGEDRKSAAYVQTDANDPNLTLEVKLATISWAVDPITNARSMETLLDTLPSGDDDDLLTINRGFERIACKRQRLALYLGLNRYISSGP